MLWQLRQLSLPHTRLALAILIISSMLFVSKETPSALAHDAIQLDAITFSQNSLVARQPLSLTLTSRPGTTIRYSTDGSLPGMESKVYTEPIFIDSPTVVRARAFDDSDGPVGEVHTRSYIIVDYEQTIPLVSIITDPLHLFWLHDYPEEHNQNQARPITLEYFAPGGQVQFRLNAGMQVHGDRSQLYGPKKSYQIVFGEAYDGPGFLEFPLFDDTAVTRFASLVLRAGNNDTLAYLNRPDMPAAETYFFKLIGDQVVRNLHRDMGQPIAHGRWVLLYFNGEFRGLYNLTEGIDKHYFRSYSNQNAAWDAIRPRSVRTSKGEWRSREVVVAGQDDAWQALQRWLDRADFADPDNLALLESQVDLENLFSFIFLQAYVQNHNWPGNGWIVYRRSDPGATTGEARWRVMVGHVEDSLGSSREGFQTNGDTLAGISSPDASVSRILGALLQDNCELRDRFRDQAREYLGVADPAGNPDSETGPLSKERVRAEILNQAAIVRPFIQLDIERWTPELSVEIFDQNIQNALTSVDEREAVMLQSLEKLSYGSPGNCE